MDKRWDGIDFVQMTRRKRWVGLGWISMNGWRWDGAQWVPLWETIVVGGVVPSVLFLNLDEAPVAPVDTLSLTFDLTKDPQYT